MQTKFNYEKKIWGGPTVLPSPFYIQGLKLKYALEDLREIHGKVADIGCGAGNMAKALKRYRADLEVFGIDISKKAIAQAKKDAGGVIFKIGAVEALPFKERSLEAVCMFDVLEHVPRPQKVLSEVRRVLKKDGIFHLFLPLDAQPGTLYHLLYKIGWQPKNKHTGHLTVYRDSDVVKLAEKVGFKIIKNRFSFHWFFSVFDIVYFSLLGIFSLKAPSSIEGMIEKKKQNPFVFLFNLFYRMVVFFGNVESGMLKNVPGGGGQYLMRKS